MPTGPVRHQVTMTPELWQRVIALYDRVLDLDEAQRRAVLALEPDERLRAEVDRLLANEALARGFLESPVLDAASLARWATQSGEVVRAGDVLRDRFEIRQFLGRGGMGEVYEALDRELRERIAIKTIRRELQRDTAVLERFRREVQRARKVTHPNICRIHDFFPGDPPFLTMEFLDGTTLAELLRRNGRMEPSAALPIVRQLCAGLDAAHRAGIVHRDFKSGNVILDSAGRAAITDFGIARTLPMDGATETVTGVTLAGTLPYMAPELLEGKPATTASDIYALGTVLYEMVTGVLPFRSDTPLVAATMRLTVPPPPPRRHAPNLPANWERAILRCLERKPDRRVASAAEIPPLLEGRWGPVGAALLRSKTTRRVALGAGSAAVLYWAFQRWRPFVGPRPGGPVTVLVADVASAEEDRRLARALRYALVTALGQSRQVRVFPESRMVAARQLLRMPADAPLETGPARFVAQRENVSRVLAAELRTEPGGHRIVARIVEPVSGSIVSTYEQTAETRETFSRAVDRLAHEVRIGLGEAGAAAAQMIPLARVTTPSLDALVRFSEALQLYNRGDLTRPLVLLKAATEIDPNFAMAYEYQALIHSARGNEELGYPAAQRAYQLRANTTERERYHIEAVYHVLRGDYERGLDGYRALTTLYPDDAQLQRHLAHNYSMLGRLEEAVESARQAVKLDPANVANNLLLSLVLAEANRAQQSLQAVRQARERGITQPALGWGEASAALVLGDLAAARAALDIMAKAEGLENIAALNRTKIVLLEGGLSEAADELEGAITGDVTRKDPINETHRRLWLGQILLLLDQPGRAREQALALANRSAEPWNLNSLRSAAELAFASQDTALLLRVAASLAEIHARYPSTRSEGYLWQSRAWVAARSGKTDEARRHMARAMALWPDPGMSWSMAEILRASGDWEGAAARYHDVIHRKGSVLRWDSPLRWVLAHVFAARCLSALKQPRSSLNLYERFLYHWGNRAGTLAIVQAASRETKRLKEGKGEP